MSPKTRQLSMVALAVGFAAFVAASFLFGLRTGERMGQTFGTTLLEMMKLLPCAFILIGLFDVWVKRETVERHFGKGSGIRGYLWSILLAGTSVGGMYVAFPVVSSLYKKGAALSVVFAYVGFAGACRIPMTMFEASFLGAIFTAVRLAVSVPLIVISAVAMATILERRGYEITE
jgi:uncharacterized membrane protein YraQ (UPF0718 family)